MYTFKSPVTVSGCKVLWYDDGGGVQTPNGLTIEYWDGEQFVPVEHEQDYTAFPKNQYGEYRFSQVRTTKLRMTMHNDQTGAAAGIVEWRLIGACESVLDICCRSGRKLLPGQCRCSPCRRQGCQRFRCIGLCLQKQGRWKLLGKQHFSLPFCAAGTKNRLVVREDLLVLGRYHGIPVSAFSGHLAERRKAQRGQQLLFLERFGK